MRKVERPPLSEELAPFAGLIDCVNELAPLAWSFEGDVMARRGDVAVPLNGFARLCGITPSAPIRRRFVKVSYAQLPSDKYCQIADCA